MIDSLTWSLCNANSHLGYGIPVGMWCSDFKVYHTCYPNAILPLCLPVFNHMGKKIARSHLKRQKYPFVKAPDVPLRSHSYFSFWSRSQYSTPPLFVDGIHIKYLWKQWRKKRRVLSPPEPVWCLTNIKSLRGRLSHALFELPVGGASHFVLTEMEL